MFIGNALQRWVCSVIETQKNGVDRMRYEVHMTGIGLLLSFFLLLSRPGGGIG